VYTIYTGGAEVVPHQEVQPEGISWAGRIKDFDTKLEGLLTWPLGFFASLRMTIGAG
jgi:hypothetical protein